LISGVQSSSHSKIRLTAILAAVFVIGMIIGLSVYPLINGPSNLQSAATATTSAVQLQTVTSQPIAVNPNSTYTIEILNVAFDQIDAPTGFSDYLLLINASYLGNGGWDLDVSHFHLTTNELSVYNATSVTAERNPLSDMTLANGQHVSGQVTFTVLNGQRPTKLEYYTDPSMIVAETENIPETSSWISLVPAVIVNYDNPTTSNLTVMATIANSTQYFYSNDLILVRITISYLQLNNSPDSIVVKSITEQDPGFTISSTNPQVPIVIQGNNQQVTVSLIILPPHSSYSGGIHVGLGFTN